MEKEVKLFCSDEGRKKYFSIYDKALLEFSVEYKSKYVDTKYGKTHMIHCSNPRKPKLMLLHCMGFASICWFNNIKILSQYYDIYCIDSIGEPGKTKSNKISISNNEFYIWLIELLDTLEIEKINLLGWSFGGFIATGFAMTYPERVDKVVVLSPAATVTKLPLNFYYKLLPALLTGKEKRINRFLKWLSGSDNTDYPNIAFEVFIAGMKYFRGWARSVKIRRYTDEEFLSIESPFLIIIGTKDPIYNKSSHKKIVKKFKSLNDNISIELVEGTHGFPIQLADIVNKRIISFIGTN